MAESQKTSNPYMTGLVSIAVIFALLGIIVIIIGLTAQDSYGVGSANMGEVIAGGGLIGAGFSSLLFALLLGGLKWVAPTGRPATPAEAAQRRGTTESDSLRWPDA